LIGEERYGLEKARKSLSLLPRRVGREGPPGKRAIDNYVPGRWRKDIIEKLARLSLLPILYKVAKGIRIFSGRFRSVALNTSAGI